MIQALFHKPGKTMSKVAEALSVTNEIEQLRDDLNSALARNAELTEYINGLVKLLHDVLNHS